MAARSKVEGSGTGRSRNGSLAVPLCVPYPMIAPESLIAVATLNVQLACGYKVFRFCRPAPGLLMS